MTIAKLYALFKQCSEVCTDTRKISKDCMFFALKGDNFNGNSFAKEALIKGAKFAVIDESEFNEKESTVLVNNALQTLQQLATYHRNQLNIPIIALTGSNGKTTTKELINAVLSTTYITGATKGNLNNHIGVPLTLLSFKEKTEIGIVEMGANHQKEIEFLTNIAQPNYGLITNFGKAHLEGFGGIEGVIRGKSELYTHLINDKATIFINKDDVLQVRQSKGYSKSVGFSKNPDYDIRVREIITEDDFVTIGYNNRTIKSQLIGHYNFNNIAFAILIGDFFKVSEENIKQAIESYTPDNNRSQIIAKGTNTIILDAYNANPTSMKAAIDNFKKLKKANKIAILGDMLELGKEAETEHQNIVAYAEKLIGNSLLFVGENFFNTTINEAESVKFRRYSDLESFLKNQNISNSTFLIKGSRGMALERILEVLN